MPKVELTRVDWDWVIMILNDCEHRGYVTNHIIQLINDQLDNQEY
jgi:hypothetical protein